MGSGSGGGPGLSPLPSTTTLTATSVRVASGAPPEPFIWRVAVLTVTTVPFSQPLLTPMKRSRFFLLFLVQTQRVIRGTPISTAPPTLAPAIIGIIAVLEELPPG